MALYHSARGSVDYTIVGTPTIVDNVVSGFSSSNYLSISSQLDTTKPFEYVTKFRVTSNNTIQSLVGISGGGIFNLLIRANAVIRFAVGATYNSFDIGQIDGSTIQINTDYFAKALFTGTKYELYLSTDGTTWNKQGEIVSSVYVNGGDPISLQIGNAHTQNWVLKGSVDLNHTYIKLNGQPWFGICPVEVKKVLLNNNTVKYIIKDGKLIWADPKLYLVNSGNAYINTGVSSNSVSNYKIDYMITDSTILNIMCGVDNGFRNKADAFMGVANNALYWYYGTDYYRLLQTSSDKYLQKNRLEVNFNSTSASASIYNNDEQISTYTTSIQEISSNNLYLFGLNRNETLTASGNLKIYSAQYYGSNINKHLVPVPQGLQIGSFTVQSNGMFDIINQQFYGNQGAGGFTIGRDE